MTALVLASCQNYGQNPAPTNAGVGAVGPSHPSPDATVTLRAQYTQVSMKALFSIDTLYRHTMDTLNGYRDKGQITDSEWVTIQNTRRDYAEAYGKAEKATLASDSVAQAHLELVMVDLVSELQRFESRKWWELHPEARKPQSAPDR